MKRLATAICMVASLLGIASIGAVAAAAPASAATGDYYTYPAENQKVIDKWNSLGRESGPLGPPTSYLTCEPGGYTCWEEFMNGVIYTNSYQPVANVIYGYRGNTGPYWNQNGRQYGSFGPALSDEVQTTTGSYQAFRNGRILWSPSTGVHGVKWTIYSKYQSLNAENGQLGYPTTEVICATGGCYQSFQRGTIYQTDYAGTFLVSGSVLTKYLAAGGPTGSLGWPVTENLASSLAGVSNQQFQKGYINTNGAVLSTKAANFTNECNSLNNGKSKLSGANAKRVSFTVAESYGSYMANFYQCVKADGIYVNEWTAPATVGKNGFKQPGEFSGPTRFMYSPTGSFSVTEAFGLGNPGTALQYKTLNPMSRWGGNPGMYNYNKYFEGSSFGYDENMWEFATMPSHDYAQGAVINYNRPPDVPTIIQDAGFAIFLHGNRVPTAGCIALDDGPLNSWLRSATPGDRIIMGVRSDLFS